MTTATSVTYEDLARLGDLMVALNEAGRAAEANTILQAYLVVQDLFFAEHFPWFEDDTDPEFVRQMEESERDYAEGRWSILTHEEVTRRLQARQDG